MKVKFVLCRSREERAHTAAIPMAVKRSRSISHAWAAPELQSSSRHDKSPSQVLIASNFLCNDITRENGVEFLNGDLPGARLRPSK